MAKFLFKELIGTNTITARLGASDQAADRLDDKDVGKLLKFAGDSRYELCAVGDKIDGRVIAVDTATTDGYSTGAVQYEKGSRIQVIFDGSEAAGAGALAVGDYVVAGTPVAKGTAQSDSGPKVRKATNQPGTAIVSTVAGADTAAAVKTVLDAALVKVADAEKNTLSAWRVVSLGSVGTGAVGTVGVIERV